jgi:signal transduction histidine kinase
MFGSSLQVRLPRRITAYFLLFGLAALVWLSFGAVYVARSVTDNRSEGASLRWLGRGSGRVVLSYPRGGDASMQAIVSEVFAKSGATYCAVVGLDGDFVAHSNPEFVGKSASERGGVTERWGEVERVEYTDDKGMLVYEYRCPLGVGETAIGTMRLGVSQPSLWSLWRAGAQYSPLAFFGPACCMVIGAVMISRMVRPVADIEEQLVHVAMSPSVECCQLAAVAGAGAAARGWNRVVQRQANGSAADSLQQRLQQSLQQGRQSRLDAVLNSIPDGVATADAAGQLTYTNLPMATILGLKDVVGGGSEGEPTEERPIVTELLDNRWNLPEGSPLLAPENCNRTVVVELAGEEHGQRRVIRVARHPICIVGSSQHETHVWTIRDVTQQKLAEEMRDQFVDTATHELRTPLANIKAYAETLALADVIDVEQQKQFLNTINSEATRLARFVDDLLSVSSMELGSLMLNKQVTDLGRVLNEVISKIRPQADEKELELEVTLPEKFPEPKLDKDKISAVLVNLLGNAVKYTPAGGRVAFHVNFTEQEIEMSVTDSGVGIAESELAKVFDKFFRSDDPRVQEQTGTGLGLALAQEVVRLHGGRIEVESELNKGSTFTVHLPRG